jgi:hypothetical protein
VCLQIEFRGGSSPQITRATRDGETLTPGEAAALLGEIDSPSIDALAVPDGDLWMRFGRGIEVLIPAGSVLEFSCAAVGPPTDLTLAGPLVIVSVGDAWVRLSNDKLRFLSSLARVRISRAILHPDGSVDLEGGARRGLDRAVRSGLNRASARFSKLVKHAPQFSIVRDFLGDT